MYQNFGRPRRRPSNNLEYYINGVRVSKQQMSHFLSQRYNMPPTKAIQQRVAEAKVLMSNAGCTAWSFPDGTSFKY